MPRFSRAVPSRALLSRALLTLALFSAIARPLAAQAWAYPAFQPPRVVAREFNFGIADAGVAGTTLLFQWREEAGPRNQLSLDVGLADPQYGNVLVLLGGQFARQLATSGPDMPLDFLFTFGAYLATGDGTLFRMPVGVSVGHHFALDQGMALTPYLHPRVSVDICGSCRRSSSDLSVDFDIGVNFDITKSLAIRASALLTGSDRFDDGFGISLAWKPPGLR
jgi:hypothetical protein